MITYEDLLNSEKTPDPYAQLFTVEIPTASQTDIDVIYDEGEPEEVITDETPPESLWSETLLVIGLLGFLYHDKLLDVVNNVLNKNSLSPVEQLEQEVSESVIKFYKKKLPTAKQFKSYDASIKKSGMNRTDRRAIMKSLSGLTPKQTKNAIKGIITTYNKSGINYAMSDANQRGINQRGIRYRAAIAYFEKSVVERGKVIGAKRVAADKYPGGKLMKRWISISDDRTTDDCNQNNGVVVKIDDSFPSGDQNPPSSGVPHPCRSKLQIFVNKQDGKTINIRT